MSHRKSKRSGRRSRLLACLLLIAGLLILFAISGNDPAPTAENDEERYSFTWDALGLPHLPDSQVTRIGISDDGNSDFEIDLDSQNSVEKVGQFFEEEFDKSDFQSGQPESDDEDRYQNEFISGDCEVSVGAEPDPNDPGASKVRIVIRKDRQVKTPAWQSATRVD